MKDKIIHFLNDDKGATSVEYALLASLIALVIILAVATLGLATNRLFSRAAEEFEQL